MFNKWSTLKKLIGLIAVGAIGEAWSTITGEIVRFMSTSALPFRLTAQFEPIQDLHGQDNPYPAGGGKNKLDISQFEVGSLDASTGNEMAAYNRVRSPFILLASGTYTISVGTGFNVVCDVYNTQEQYIMPESYYTWSEGNTRTITLVGDRKVRILFRKSDNSNIQVSDVPYGQLESGSTATAWSPYENICPVYGHTGCEVVQRNNNLLSYYNEAVPYEANGVTITRNENVYTVSVSDQKTGWPFARICTLRGLKAGTYTLSCEKDGEQYSDVGLGLRIVNRTVNPAVVIMSTGTTTIANDIEEDLSVEIALTASAVQTGTYYVTGQLELGSVATKHVAPQGTTKIITFPDAAGTVYSGTLTVNEDGSGQIVATDAPLLFDNSAWSFTSGFFYKSFASILQGVCVADYYTTENGVKMYLNSNNGQIRIYLVDNSFLTSESDVGALLNGNKLLYKLATPITIPLTAEQVGQLTTLVGENNVWVNDSDEITVVVRGTPIPDDEPSALQSLNILLGGAYTPRQSPNEPKDSEALGIILGS